MKRTYHTIIASSKLILFSCFIAFALASCSDSGDDMEEMMDENPGEMKDMNAKSAPDFSLKALDGSTVALNDFEDKVLVLFFFGNSCPSCKAAAPKVQTDIADAFASNAGFAIIGLDQWNGKDSAVQGFKNTTGVNFPLLLNASSVASDYNTTYDRLIVVDQDGKIVFKGSQGASKDISAVVTKVKSLL
ncbi:MAG: TlpA family protein disulfide reductase [Carboxylicivirga sp.]|nr:TlpA family protein disulfide reductase [Carboxylicivirga sp.]MCT4645193.1 TlpA family protein disulfide reductase [Carboxylicivirga sp.]